MGKQIHQRLRKLEQPGSILSNLPLIPKYSYNTMAFVHDAATEPEAVKDKKYLKFMPYYRQLVNTIK
jgi:hypothetical protein